jgi:replicative DNA helicase
MRSGLKSSLLKDFERWSDEYIAELEDRSKGKKYPYGDENLDEFIFKGAYPGAITTIAASTGQGKSTYVLNLISTLIDRYIPCMYASLEMSGIDTYDRLIALRREIPMSDLHTCDSSLLSVIDVVKEEKESLKANKNFYFVEEPSLSIARLRALVKEFKQRAKTDYAIIAVDLVTQLTDFMHNKGNSSVANSIETAMNDLNALAKEQNVHIIAVVQFNREADNFRVSTIEELDMLRPTLNHIKNSAAIAERSRVVLSLFRKKYYSDRYLIGVEGADLIPDLMETTILKNSSGPVGHVFYYAFEGEFFRCTPMLEDQVTKMQAAAELEIDY